MNWRSSLLSFNSSGATRRARFSSSFPFPAPVPIPHAPPTDSEQAQMSFPSVGNLNRQETLCGPETSCNTLPKAWNLPQAEQEREWEWSSNMNGRVPATSDRTARHTVLIDTPAALSLPSTKLQTNHEPHIPRLVPRMLYFSLTAFTVLLLVSCGKQPSDAPANSASSNANTSKPVIAMLPKLINIDYFDACKRGGQKAADELGVTLIFDGPTEPSGAEQNKFIDTWIRQRSAPSASRRTSRRPSSASSRRPTRPASRCSPGIATRPRAAATSS